MLREVGHALQNCGVAPGQGVVTGFSGGTDSLALAVCLAALRVPQVLVHMDHGLRVESRDDARQAQALAERLGVPIEVRAVNVAALAEKKGLGLEDAGRRARYAVFEDARVAHGLHWTAVGHQADDLVEDVIMRLVRGAGWPALGGMCAVDVQRRVVRPLLHVPRRRLEALVAETGLSPIEDASNEQDIFLRNRIRRHVVPLLKAENPSLHAAVRRLHTLARVDETFWDTHLAPALDCVCLTDGSVSVAEAVLKPLHAAARLRLYGRMLSMVPGAGQARTDTLLALDRALLEPQRPKVFQLPGSVLAELAAGALIFSCNKK